MVPVGINLQGVAERHLKTDFGEQVNPHYNPRVEYSRTTSPAGTRDAVLVNQSGSNWVVYVVAAGQETYGHHHLIALIHVSGPLSLKWLDEETIYAAGTFDDYSNAGSGCPVRREGDRIYISVS